MRARALIYNAQSSRIARNRPTDDRSSWKLAGGEPARLARRNINSVTDHTVDNGAQRRSHSERGVMANTHSKLKWIVAVVGMIAVADLALHGWSLLRAAPAPSTPVPRVETVVARAEAPLQAGLVDRSRKGDRLLPAGPVAKGKLPPGCESQSSPLARLAPPNMIRQCVT